jgi:arginyl-tRNA synthetase
LQYAYARICSIKKKARSEKVYPSISKRNGKKTRETEEELALIQKMADLPELLILIAIHREPHRLTTYIEELASLLHHYYEKYQIVNARNLSLSQARLCCFLPFIKSYGISFELMGISAPEKM